MLVLIKGAGDLATGTAVRLYRAGIPVVMTEVARPTAVRRTVAFSQCMYDGAAQVEGISARRAEDAGAARRALERGKPSAIASVFAETAVVHKTVPGSYVKEQQNHELLQE